jgi:endonuclease YncB( thermonuclease family)
MIDGTRAGLRSRLTRRLVGGALIAVVAVALIRHFTAAPAVQQEVAAAPSAAPGDAKAPARGAVTAPANIVPETNAALPSQPLVRDVTPEGFARVYGLPQSDTQRRPSRSIQIANAAVTPSGAITGDGKTVHLYGVMFPDAKRICATASGERWPCGRRAYIALHNKVIGQAVSCAPRAATDPPAADCFLGEVNLAAWLLGQGLTRLMPDVTDKELIAAEAAGRRAKAGLWLDPTEAAPASAAQGR